MKYQRRKQKKTKRTIIVSPSAPMETVIKQEIDDVMAQSTSGSDEGEQSEDGGLEHFLTRRVHPRKGTSKKLFPAHASRCHSKHKK